MKNKLMIGALLFCSSLSFARGDPSSPSEPLGALVFVGSRRLDENHLTLAERVALRVGRRRQRRSERREARHVWRDAPRANFGCGHASSS